MALGAVLYLILLIIPDMPVHYPKYKLEFQNGQNYIITVFPEISRPYDKKRVLKESFHPSPRLVSKRINEFARDNNISAKLKTAIQINSAETNFSEFIHSFFSMNLVLKVIAIYVFLLIIRFILWAAKIIKVE